MQLHEKSMIRSIGVKLAPALSLFIYVTNLTNFVRKCIAFQNYLIGQGAGLGWEEDEALIAKSKIYREKSVVFDVGANNGDWSFFYRKHKQSGTLHMFDPQEECIENIKKKSITNAQIHHCAVGSERGQMSLFSSSDGDSSASLHSRGDSYFSNREYTEKTVNVISLDDFTEEAQRLLSSNQIGAMSIEFGSGNLNSRTCFRDFWDLLNEHYYFEIILPCGKLRTVDHYYEDLEYYRGVLNMVLSLKSHPFAYA